MKISFLLAGCSLIIPNIVHAQTSATTPPADATSLVCTFLNGDEITYIIDLKGRHAWMSDAALAGSQSPPGPEFSIQVDGPKITIEKPDDLDPSDNYSEEIDLDNLTDSTEVNSNVVNSAPCVKN